MKHVLLATAVLLATGASAEILNVSNGEELAAAVKSVKSIRAANRDAPVEILLASGDYDVPGLRSRSAPPRARGRGSAAARS